MNEKIEEIFESPIQVRIGILVGVIVLLAAGYWYFMFSPVVAQLSEINGNIDGLKLQIAEKVGIAANLDKFEKEVERLDFELKRALLELPDRREIDQLLDRISDRAKDAGLEITLFKPTGENVKDFYAEVPVQLDVTGSYHQLATFFDEVAHLGRIVNLQIYSMGKPTVTPKGVILDASLLATSFRFLDETERPGGGEKGEKKGKKKGKKKAKEE